MGFKDFYNDTVNKDNQRQAWLERRAPIRAIYPDCPDGLLERLYNDTLPRKSLKIMSGFVVKSHMTRVRAPPLYAVTTRKAGLIISSEVRSMLIFRIRYARFNGLMELCIYLNRRVSGMKRSLRRRSVFLIPFARKIKDFPRSKSELLVWPSKKLRTLSV